MVDAGLLKNKKKLTVAQIQENLQTVLGAEADTSAAIASFGLSASIEGQADQTVKLTAKKLQEAVATNVLTEAQAQEFAMRTGLTFTMQKQTADTLPKWIATLKAGTKAIWEQVKAIAAWLVTNPAGWAILAVAATIGLVKIIDLITISVEEQREKLDDLKQGYSEITSNLDSLNSKLSTTEQRMKELEKIESPTFAEQEEYDNLVKTNNELQRKIDLLKLEEKTKGQEVRKAFVSTMEKDTDNFIDKDDKYFRYTLGKNVVKKSIASYLISSSLIQAVPEDELISIYEEYKNELNELDEKYAYDIGNSTYKKTREKLEKEMDDLSSYMQNKSNQWASDSNDIHYIKNPTSEDDRAVNKWLDYIADYQDRMAIVMDGNNSKINAFNRIVDNWYFDDTVQELQDLGKQGQATADMLDDPKYDEFINKLVSLGVIDSADNLDDVAIAFNSATLAAENAANSTEKYNTKNSNLFNITTYKDEIDDIQSAISTLRSALDSFNSGTLDESAVIDLMQQFPELIPYIDLTAEGFGNLSEGLSTLIAQQPDSLIDQLEQLKSSLSTDEERKQIDLLIDSLQRLSSYGDSGIEAYAATISNTWGDTANVIEGVTTQFENLAKVQETVADGLTISATAAAELAKMYPEILTNAVYAGKGQITLNEEVVKTILDGDRTVIDSQITKLEADKALLAAKKAFAEAQLKIAKQVGEGEGKITEEVAKYKINISNILLKTLIDAGLEESRAYEAVAANMSGNMEEYNRIVGEVGQDTASNMENAAVTMADATARNSMAAQESMHSYQKKIWDVADAIRGIPQGQKRGNEGTYSTNGGTYGKHYIPKNNVRQFTPALTAALNKFLPQADPNQLSDADKIMEQFKTIDINIDEFQSQLEIDIKGYTDAISNIDAQIEILKDSQRKFEANGGIGGHGYTELIEQLEKEKSELTDTMKNALSSESIDFFDRRVKVLDNSLSHLKSTMDNVAGSFGRNKLIDAELGITEEKFNNYSDALAMYTRKADEALSKLPANIAARVRDGAVAMTDFVGDNKDLTEAIKDYESWADKISDCKQELAELQKEIRQLELDKFNNIMDDFNNQFDLRGDSKDLISRQIDLLKEAGELVGESFFTAQIDQSRKQLELLETEKTQLVNQMSSAIGSGRIQKGADEWLEMVNALSDVDSNILDCKKSIEEFDNSILELHTEVFDRIQKQFSDLDAELSNLIDLSDEFDVSDDRGGWTKEGLAQMGLLAQQYELAQYQVQQYNAEIDELNSQYLVGRYSASEYADRLSELSSSQWDAVKASESAKDAILELNETRVENEITGIEKEIEAYNELTQAQIDALKASKDLHDYEQSIAEKTKSITDLERQIAAMLNDDSAATVAKRKKLEEQLAEARKDLEEAEYDHSIEAQENALNKQSEDYENARNNEIDALRESLNDKEAILAASFETVRANASLIGQEIATLAAEHGITVSNSLIFSWQSGENAIASYGTALSQGTSAFISSIMGVENEVWNLQAQANTTADTLAGMFATKADNLVSELTTSYISESNLLEMTDALHQSLIETLEGGYDVSSIKDSLKDIEDSFNGTAEAAREAANAMNGVTIPSEQGREISEPLLDVEKVSHTTKLQRYADGTRSSKGDIIVTDEEGYELKLPKLGSGQYTIANEGTQIFTKEQTDNLFKLSQLDPLKLLPANLTENLRRSAEIVPVVNRTVNHTPVQIGNLVNVQGSVDSSNIKQMESIANKAVNNLVNKMYDGFIYGR